MGDGNSIEKDIIFLKSPLWNDSRKDSSLSVLIIFFPGVFTAPERYRGFHQALLDTFSNSNDGETSSICIHIGMGRFSDNFPQLEESKNIIQDVLEQAKKELDKQPDQIYPISHWPGADSTRSH